MKAEERFCSNCREPLPARAAWCEKCGTDAGDVFDGKMPRKKSAARGWLFALIVLAAAAVAVFLYRDDARIPNFLRTSPKFDTGPIGVVRQRPGETRRPPGAKLNQAEATRALRAYLVAQKSLDLKSECLAVASRGYSQGFYVFDAVDSCHASKLGRFIVDGKTAEVRQ